MRLKKGTNVKTYEIHSNKIELIQNKTKTFMRGKNKPKNINETMCEFACGTTSVLLSFWFPRDVFD